MWQRKRLLNAEERRDLLETLHTLEKLLDQETDPESIRDLEARIARLEGELNRFSVPDDAFKA